MPLLVYIGAVMGILYYLGIIQVAAGKVAWLMQSSMGTTAIETLGVTANIFLNGVSLIICELIIVLKNVSSVSFVRDDFSVKSMADLIAI